MGYRHEYSIVPILMKIAINGLKILTHLNEGVTNFQANCFS